MKKLTVTLEDRSYLQKYRELGVDEVILACKDHTFSALHEFEKEEILEITEQTHACNMQVIVLMNRLYDENDAFDAQMLMKELLASGIDMIMFQDPSFLKKAKEEHLEAHLIYRPETLMTSVNDASFWMRQGLQSVMIPSLLTKDEIIEIASTAEHTTVLIHGHTLMSVSKRKLLSSYQKVSGKQFDVHSGKLTLQEKQRDGLMPIYENAYACMIYSDFIQETFQEMDAFMKAGVERFEIDTAFMKEDMILDAIGIYHDILLQKDVHKQIQTYLIKYKDLDLSDGYYGEKTIK